MYVVFNFSAHSLMIIVSSVGFSLAGFDDTSVACCGTGMYEMGYSCARNNFFSCTDANKFVFWDSFHPTEKTNRIIADHLVKTTLAVFL